MSEEIVADGAAPETTVPMAPAFDNALTFTVVEGKEFPCLQYLADEVDCAEELSPFTQVSFKLGEAAVVQSQVNSGSSPSFNLSTEMPLRTKDPKALDWLCSASVAVDIAEFAEDAGEDSEAMATYQALVPLVCFVEGETGFEGWFPVKRTGPVDLEAEFAVDESKDDLPVQQKRIAEQFNKNPMVYIKAEVKAPMLSAEDLATSVVVILQVDKLEGVPRAWLADYEGFAASEEVKKTEEEQNKLGFIRRGAKKGGKEGKGKEAKKAPVKKKGDVKQVNRSFKVQYQMPLDEGGLHAINYSTQHMQLPDASLFPPKYPPSCLEEGGEEVPGSASNSARSKEGSDSTRSKKKGGVDKKVEAERAARQKEREEAEQASLELRKQNRSISWAFERKCFLLAPAVASFKHAIKQAQRFKFQVTREEQETLDEEGKEASITASWPAEAQMLLRSLLKEGEVSVTALCPVRMTAATLREIEEEAARLKAEAAEAESAKKKKNHDEIMEEDVNQDPDFYALSDSRVSVSVTLSKPLVPVSSTPKLLPSDLIPSRTPPARVPPTPTEEFDEEINDMLKFLARDFSFAGEQKGWSPEQARERKREMLYNINRGGTYRLFKEKLKPPIVKILREHLTKEAEARGEVVSFQDPLPESQLPLIISKLHSMLIDKIHLNLNRTVATKITPQPVTKKAFIPPLPDLNSTDLGTFGPSTLKTLAQEKELQERFSEAAVYHERRVAMEAEGTVRRPDEWRPDDCSEHWHDYAMFWLRVGNAAEAERCLKEAIAINPTFTQSLLAYLSMLLDKNDLQSSEVFSRALKAMYPNNWLVMSLEGLFLDSSDEKALCEEAYQVANELFEAFVAEGADLTSDPLLSAVFERKTMQPGSLLVQVSRYLLSVNCADIASFALQRSLENEGASKWLDLQCAQAARFQGDAVKSCEAAKACIAKGKNDGEVIEAFSVMGHALWDSGDVKSAVEAFETYLAWEPENADPLLLFRLSTYHKNARNTARSLDINLELCKNFPCAFSWLGVGTALLETKDFAGARRALQEANKLDNTNAQVWGALCLLHLSTGHATEAKTCFKYSCDLSLDDATLLRNIGIGYLEKGLLALALAALKHSLKLETTVSTLILLGDVQGELNCSEELLSYYIQAFEMCGPDGDKKLKVETAKRIVTTLMSLGRDEEARGYLESTDMQNGAGAA